MRDAAKGGTGMLGAAGGYQGQVDGEIGSWPRWGVLPEIEEEADVRVRRRKGGLGQ